MKCYFDREKLISGWMLVLCNSLSRLNCVVMMFLKVLDCVFLCSE